MFFLPHLVAGLFGLAAGLYFESDRQIGRYRVYLRTEKDEKGYDQKVDKLNFFFDTKEEAVRKWNQWVRKGRIKKSYIIANKGLREFWFEDKKSIKEIAEWNNTFPLQRMELAYLDENGKEVLAKYDF